MASRKKSVQTVPPAAGRSNFSVPVELQSIADLIEHKLDEKFTEFKDTLEKYATKEQVEKLQANIRLNYYNNDKLEQYTRRENMRIHGWKFDPKADLSGQVVDLLNHAVDLSQNGQQAPPRVDVSKGPIFNQHDISICHPIKAKDGSVKQQVIVRFVSRAKLYQAFRVKKYLKKSEALKGVYITDDLTPLRMKLFAAVKAHSGTSDVYTRDGSTHCTYKGKHHVISSPDDLFHIEMEVDFDRLGLTHLK